MELTITKAENGWIINMDDRIYVADDMYGLKVLVQKLMSLEPEEI